MQPFFVESVVDSGRQWITLLPAPKDNVNYQLTINWTGRYQALDPVWMLAAVPSNWIIDDVYGTRQVTNLCSFAVPLLVMQIIFMIVR